MSDQEVFGGWSEDALKEYLRENGAPIPLKASKKQLIEACGRAARTTEQRVISTTSKAPPGGNGHAVGVPVANAMWPPPVANQAQPPQHQQSGVPRPMPRQGGGRKKALIIGVNYFGTRNQLNGCINDARCMSYLLEHRMGFPPSGILLMADDHPDPMRRPTRYNIYQGIQWLMTDMQPGDSLVFHFSGHGSQQRDYTGQEADGMNETILPMDFKQAGEIVDDELNRMLVQPLPQGVKLHAIVDACHSGSALDLPYQAVCHQGHVMWQTEYAPQHLRQMKAPRGGFAVQISAAQDYQTAADTNRMTGIHTGAATYAFIKCIEDRGLNISYRDLLVGMYFVLQAVNGGSGGGGGGGGVLGGMLGSLLGSSGGSFQGQEPVLSGGYVFDLNFKLDL